MKKRRLGKTGFEVSEIGFGCWAIGGTGYGPTTDEVSLAALETAWEAGVNFFDTADTYGNGHSEDLLARFVRARQRDRMVLAGKAGWDFYHGGTRKNFDPAYLRFACEQSLERLGTDYLDLLQLHNPSQDVLLRGDAVGELEKMKKEGLVRAIGVSAHRPSEVRAAIEDGRIETLQIVFNLLDARMQERVFAEIQKHDLGLIVREPLACGLLSGKYSSEHVFEKTDHRRRWQSDKRKIDEEKVRKLKGIIVSGRLSLVRAALEFVLDHEEVSVVIPGAKTPAQVRENTAASLEPALRIQESTMLKQLITEDPVFREGLMPLDEA